MNKTATELFHELSFYTLSHPNTVYFIHQHSVDAFHAQNANSESKPITIIFSLIGLYLYIERGYSGRKVQEAHLALAKRKKKWALLELPDKRGNITVSHVIAAVTASDKDRMIKQWCSSVWGAYQSWHSYIAAIAKTELV